VPNVLNRSRDLSMPKRREPEGELSGRRESQEWYVPSGRGEIGREVRETKAINGLVNRSAAETKELSE